MKKVVIAVGTDHRGFEHKEHLKKTVTMIGDSAIEWLDVGAFDAQRSDYPIYGQKACEAMLAGKAQLGVLLCGTGVGMAVAANRYKDIYAGLVWNETVARKAREDDGINILVLPSDFITQDQACTMVHAWFVAQFRGGRYQDRIEMIDRICGC